MHEHLHTRIRRDGKGMLGIEEQRNLTVAGREHRIAGHPDGQAVAREPLREDRIRHLIEGHRLPRNGSDDMKSFCFCI